MARSITTRADRDQAQIGSNLSYAAIQQLGGQGWARP
ncbi:phage virion morphogenesis protein [Pseudomonas aeruginosa]